ncbi:hypothetical protein GQ602_000612 [Ophiocordyceps camponoti-floridani]|uniref:Uncharacterized protein n=1 Tax=Ophiocordyceps camponoti-floridani TaxID=2030778 RepID=A0A8H4QCH9_9HYPO|nr:hypothetical protein GQ602_000612 [Ophiocordyceps camponoti-floridani]
MPPVDQRVDGIPDDRELPYRLAICPALPTVNQFVSLPGHDDNHDDNHDDHHDDGHDDAMLNDADSAAASAPALPQKSASRLLASLSQKTAPEDRPILPHAAPHQMYLSSEEDASSSADDMSDLDELDWDAADSRKSSTSSSCSSREDTARVVTVVFHGRPSLVELVPRKSTGSTDGPRPTPLMLRTATEPTLMRTRSNSSESSAALKHPPRSSSMTPTGFQMRRPQFLTIDPFASHDSESITSRTPKTPSRMLKKTLSLEQTMTLTTTLTPPSPPLEQLGEEPEDDLPPRAASAADHRESVTYQGIMKNAMRNAQAAARTDTESRPQQHRSLFRSGLSINRPRSVRA